MILRMFFLFFQGVVVILVVLQVEKFNIFVFCFFYFYFMFGKDLDDWLFVCLMSCLQNKEYLDFFNFLVIIVEKDWYFYYEVVMFVEEFGGWDVYWGSVVFFWIIYLLIICNFDRECEVFNISVVNQCVQFIQ